MTPREQTGGREFYRLTLAYDDFTNLLRKSVDLIRHSGMICGENVFRKHCLWGKEYPACYCCRCSCFVVESDKSSVSEHVRVRSFGRLTRFQTTRFVWFRARAPSHIRCFIG